MMKQNEKDLRIDRNSNTISQIDDTKKSRNVGDLAALSTSYKYNGSPLKNKDGLKL